MNDTMSTTATITMEPTTTLTRDTTPTFSESPSKGRKSYDGKASPKLKLVNTGNIKIDPLRALEPARKKLCMLESQRIISVVEDTIKRAEIVTLLPYIFENLDRFNVAFGADLMGLLRIHKATEESYLEIREQLNSMKRPETGASSQSAVTPSMEHARDDDSDVDDDADDYVKKENNTDENRDSLDDKEKKEELFEVKRRGSSRGDINKDLGEEKYIFKTEEMMGAKIEYDDEFDRSSHDHRLTVATVSSATSPADMIMKQLSLVAEQLSNSCKNILRAFMGNPAAVKVVLSEQAKRNETCDNFCVNLNELREILLNKLLMTPIEAKEKKDYLAEIALRETQNCAAIAKLDVDLNANNAEKEVEIKKRNDIIRKLQADLHQIERLSDENIRRMKTDSEKQMDVDTKNSDARQQKLKNDLSYHATQLQTFRDEHKEMESNMRKKKFKVETEVENWIQKYDQDMGERQDEYEEIDAIYTEEKKQLHELEERFKTLEEEYNRILELRQLERLNKERADREMHLMMRCATTIQAFWRSFKVRKMLKAKKKGKGKGKGKKK